MRASVQITVDFHGGSRHVDYRTSNDPKSHHNISIMITSVKQMNV